MQLLQTDVNNKNMTKNQLLSSHDKNDAVTVHPLYISFNSLQGNVADVRAGKSSGFKQETVVPLIISSSEILNLDFWLPLDLQICLF